MANIVAIVGRPNVGKSTFFNRMVGGREAIVDEISGVTRDRHYGKTEWGGLEFTLVDTGGYIKGSDDVFEGEIRKQVVIAIEEATVVLFLVDVQNGITDLDLEVADILRKTKKKVILASNKVDNNQLIAQASEFYSLGLGEVFCISSVSGSGTGDLLDEIIKHLDRTIVPAEEDLPRIAIVGKPNVGKSSLTNALLGYERNIVTDIAGTTREAIDTRYNAFGFEFVLIDTAGVRKKSKVHEDLEFYSVMRSIKAIESSHVCLLMIDATEEISSQDLNIFSLAVRNHKGIVILVNKWDLIEKDTHTTKQYEQLIKERIAPFTDVPIIFTSIPEKQRIHKALETAIDVYKNRQKRIKTAVLNEVMLKIIDENPPPSNKGKFIKIKFVTQLPTPFPSFAFFCNSPQYVAESYKRYLENKMREVFDFSGVPINLFFRQK